MKKYFAIVGLIVIVVGVILLTQQSSPKTVKSISPTGKTLTHQCSAGDYAMQCALPPVKPSLTLKPSSQGVFGYGVDFAWGGPSAATLRANGKVFGASYFSPDLSKNWTGSLVRSYHLNGRATVGVYESSQFRAQDGCSAGTADANLARRQAAAVGNTDRPIYFAVDYDTTPNPGAIYPYFRCVKNTLGLNRTGGYGGIATIRYLFNHELISYGWQAYAWSSGCGGTCWDPRAQIQQYLNDVNIGGVGTDLDRAMNSNYGQWPFRAPVVRVHCFGPKAHPNAAHCRGIRARVSKRSRARDSTIHAIQLRHCESANPPRHHTYNNLRRWYPRIHRHPHTPCGILRQRVIWFEGKIHEELY